MGDSLIPEALSYVRDAGLIGLFIVAMIGGWRKWWVWGWQLDECCARERSLRDERDEWKRMVIFAQAEMFRQQQQHEGRDGC